MIATESLPALQSPLKKVKTVDTADIVQRLNDVDKKLSDLMIHLSKCDSPKDDEDDDEDEIGDANSPWSGYIMKLAGEIDTLRQERFDLARELKTYGIIVEPIDDGY